MPACLSIIIQPFKLLKCDFSIIKIIFATFYFIDLHKILKAL